MAQHLTKFTFLYGIEGCIWPKNHRPKSIYSQSPIYQHNKKFIYIKMPWVARERYITFSCEEVLIAVLSGKFLKSQIIKQGCQRFRASFQLQVRYLCTNTNEQITSPFWCRDTTNSHFYTIVKLLVRYFRGKCRRSRTRKGRSVDLW